MADLAPTGDRLNTVNKFGRLLCGAHGKHSGKTCGHPAGYRTNHLGVGRCKFHGGLTPVKHGRYSAMHREELRGLIEKFEADPEPLNILPELASMRALFQDYVDRYDKNRDALLAWYETSLRGGGQPERPRQILDISDASRLLAEVTKIAKRIEDIRAQNAVSRPDLLRILSEMSNVVALHVTDEATRQKIKNGWSSIRL
jgi:hypothetical protein